MQIKNVIQTQTNITKKRKEQSSGGNSCCVCHPVFFIHHVSNANAPPSHLRWEVVLRVQNRSNRFRLRVEQPEGPPRPNYRTTTANNTCPDDVMLSRVSHTRLKTYSVLKPPSSSPLAALPESIRFLFPLCTTSEHRLPQTHLKMKLTSHLP